MVVVGTVILQKIALPLLELLGPTHSISNCGQKVGEWLAHNQCAHPLPKRAVLVVRDRHITTRSVRISFSFVKR